MKREIIFLAECSVIFIAFPFASHAQQERKQQVDTSKIPASQRLQNWEDSSTAKTLEGVVVVAYGAQKKSSVTGAVAQLSEKMIAKRPVTNIADALAGSAPGVQSTLGGGQPGGSPNIRLRGFGSISAGSSPLIVVDG